MSSVCSSSPCCWPIVIQSPPCTPEADPLVQTSCLELGTLHQVLDLEYTKLYLVSMTKLFPLYWTFSGKSNKMYVYLKGTSYIFFQAENRSNINSSKNKSMGKQILHTTKSNVSICDGPVQRNILNIYTLYLVIFHCSLLLLSPLILWHKNKALDTKMSR